MFTAIRRALRAALVAAIALAITPAVVAQRSAQPNTQPNTQPSKQAGQQSTRPAIFADLPFQKAVDATRGTDRVLVVKFTASWCPPCKMMDRTTWVDETVIDWFKAHGTAIAVDVDEQPDIAKAASVRAMPTMVAYRDGSEFDRVVGFQSAQQMIAWADGVSRGVKAADNDELAKIRPARVRPESPMLERFSAARELLENGKHEEAAAEFVWLWDNMAKQDPSMVGVRRSFFVQSVKSLIESHPPAVAPFAQRRDDLEARLKTDRRTFDDLMDWLALNQALSDEDRTLAWFDRIKSQPDSAATIRRVDFVLRQLLIERERWADVALVLPSPANWVTQQSSGYLMGQNFVPEGEEREMMLGFMRQNYVSELSTGYRAWLAAGRLADAAEMARLARQIDAQPDLISALVTAALDQGVPLPEHGEWMNEAGIGGDLKARWERAMKEPR